MSLYESNITIIKREYNEQRIKENLEKRVEFFKKNKRAELHNSALKLQLFSES